MIIQSKRRNIREHPLHLPPQQHAPVKNRRTITTHIWDGANIVADIEGSSVTTYLRGVNLIASVKGSTKNYYLYNAHGDVVSYGSRAYKYDAFGNELAANSGDTNPFRYAGEYFDGETETYYLRARYYSPSTGRFMSEDPIKDGLNFYTYCGGNPIAFIDSLGLAMVSLVDYVESQGGSVTWHDGVNSARVTYGNEYMWIYSTAEDFRNRSVYVNDEILNNKFGWGIAMAGMVFELSGGFKGRIERGEGGNDYQRHVHIYKGSQQWSQNEDGSPHDDGKNSPGSPPSKVLKDLEKKKGWNWNTKASEWYFQIEFDYSEAQSDLRAIRMIFPDGSEGYYGGIKMGYYTVMLNEPSIEKAYEIYLKVRHSSNINMDNPLFLPTPNIPPVPVIIPEFVPIPLFG